MSIERTDALLLDTTGLVRANGVGDTYRPYALGMFLIQAGIASPEEAVRIRYPYGIVSKALRWFQSKVLRQKHVGWEPGILRSRGDLYLDGYWQSPKYFEDIRAILLKDLSLASPLAGRAASLAEKMRETDSVSIHVRRGDYVENAKVHRSYGACSPSYYLEAQRRIRETMPVPVWFVFSDDIAWVRKHLSFPGETVYVSDGTITTEQELMLMSVCKHNIIANSSFSWWGAWLNQNPEKMVIAPKPWFDIKKDEHKDLIPDTWILLPKN